MGSVGRWPRVLAARGWALVLDARGVEALDAVAGELGAGTDVVAVAGDGRTRRTGPLSSC
jgi:NADP-dependent 3-hydroxy acid dehydrogenase YdfG